MSASTGDFQVNFADIFLIFCVVGSKNWLDFTVMFFPVLDKKLKVDFLIVCAFFGLNSFTVLSV